MDVGGAATPELLAAVRRQARAAARDGVSLAVLLRSYLAGYTTFADVLIQEAAAREPVQAVEVQRAVQACSSLFDDLVHAVTEAYAAEPGRRGHTDGG